MSQNHKTYDLTFINVYSSSFILIFLKDTALPCSWRRICPSAASPKLGHILYLLFATRALHASFPLSYSTVF